MSLIEEALRRIEAEAKRSAKAPNATPAEAVGKPEKLPVQPRVPEPIRTEPVETATARFNPWIGFGVAAAGSVLLLVVGLWLGLWWRLTTNEPAHAAKATGAAAGQSAPAASMRPPSAPVSIPSPGSEFWPNSRQKTPTPRPSFKLNGVVRGVGEPFVIVNGRIIRLGETIENAMFIGVREDAAVFRWHGEELVVQSGVESP